MAKIVHKPTLSRGFTGGNLDGHPSPLFYCS